MDNCYNLGSLVVPSLQLLMVHEISYCGHLVVLEMCLTKSALLFYVMFVFLFAEVVSWKRQKFQFDLSFCLRRRAILECH